MRLVKMFFIYIHTSTTFITFITITKELVNQVSCMNCVIVFECSNVISYLSQVLWSKPIARFVYQYFDPSSMSSRIVFQPRLSTSGTLGALKLLSFRILAVLF